MKMRCYQEMNEEALYVAAFSAWGSALRREAVLREEMRKWCYTAFGHPEEERWKDDILWGEVRFRDEKDLALFLLRWAACT